MVRTSDEARTVCAEMQHFCDRILSLTFAIERTVEEAQLLGPEETRLRNFVEMINDSARAVLQMSEEVEIHLGQVLIAHR